MSYFFNFEKLDYLKGRKPDGCILCLIKDSSPDVTDLSVFRDELFIISLNLYPYNPGHLLIFPLRHIEDIRDFTAEEENHLTSVLRMSIDVLDETHSPSGYNIGYNMGSIAGASINHLHMHVIPRYPREIGISELVSGKRVLVENPLLTQKKLKDAFAVRLQ